MAITRSQRESTLETPFRDMLAAARLDIHTALPGIIQSFDAKKMTCTVQPAIRGAIIAKDGKASAVDLPLLVDCPVLFQGGGGYSLTFPLRKGDDCLVIFAERCIDAWYQSGGIQNAAEYRLHDLSDGFVLAGVRSQPAVVKNGVTMTGPELRTDSGSAFLRLKGNAIEIVAPSGITIDTPQIQVTGDVIAGGISLIHHVHGGCQGGTTGQPQ